MGRPSRAFLWRFGQSKNGGWRTSFNRLPNHPSELPFEVAPSPQASTPSIEAMLPAHNSSTVEVMFASPYDGCFLHVTLRGLDPNRALFRLAGIYRVTCRGPIADGSLEAGATRPRRHGADLSRIHAVELRFACENEPTERWSELTSTRFEPVALTFSGLRSSRSTWTASLRLTGAAYTWQ